MCQCTVDIAACQQVSTALNVSRRRELDITSRRQRAGLLNTTLATLYGKLFSTMQFAMMFNVISGSNVDVSSSLSDSLLRVRLPTKLSFAADCQCFPSLQVPSLITYANTRFGTYHADMATVHAPHLSHIYRQFRSLAVRAQRCHCLAVRTDVIAPRHHGEFLFSPDTCIDLHCPRQNIDISGIMTRITIEPAAFNAHHTALNLISSQAAICVQLRFAGRQSHAPGIDSAAPVAHYSRRVSYNHLSSATSHFQKPL
ncbi:hypothetical protein Xmau_02097 [Xenorhabdus mauleonii]|uniref:Uncharacterized protein n=1 Tax=Xenorhabdus mauleonii TaxID=351675 RepID=A0A2G0P028_9GAMM|nr:hypothetical protein Xmau_02097 [Xenorhabdus mauleonii]